MKLLVYTFLPVLTSAIIEWPFYNKNSKTLGTQLQLSVGTPAQIINVSVNMWMSQMFDLDVFEFDGISDGFNPNTSSTFKKTGAFKDNRIISGISGVDNFELKSSSGAIQKLKQLPFNVLYRDSYPSPRSIFSLYHSSSRANNTFLDALLATQSEKTVTLVYDSIPAERLPFSGTLILGGQSNMCDTNWHMVNDYMNFKPGYPEWQMNIKKISVGRFVTRSVGTLLINIDTPFFKISKNVYDSVARELSVSSSGSLVPCDSTKNIVYELDGYELYLTPDVYVGEVKRKNRCEFYGIPQDSVSGYYDYELPSRFFGQHCLKLDYEKNQIGFAKKLK